MDVPSGPQVSPVRRDAFIRPAEAKVSGGPRVRDALAVFALALSLRLLFGALLADIYDGDEFVALDLARSVAHGAVPYRNFMYFHPPGLLLLLRLIDPVTSAWWPLARIGVMVVDSITAVLVWRIAYALYERKTAFVSGVVYAASPIAVLAGGHVLPDPVCTAFGMAGLAVLVVRPSPRAAVTAGALLAAAVWIKYPALLFLPIYALAARHRLRPIFFGFVLTSVCLFAAFLPVASQLWSQTVVWQLSHRVARAPLMRVSNVAGFWIAANPLAAIALMWGRKRSPLWVAVGYCAGGLFLLAPQSFYHYFVPTVPFAALLAGPLIAPVITFTRRKVLLSSIALACACSVALAANASTTLVADGSRMSDIAPTLALIRRSTLPGDAVLADRFEYAFLSGRHSLPYFWNMRDVVDRAYIDKSVTRARVAVMTRHLGARSYPLGATKYLDSRYPRRETKGSIVWMMTQSDSIRPTHLLDAPRTQLQSIR